MSNQNENEELPGMLALAKGVQEGAWPHTMDAQVWAQKWLEITKDKPEVATDEGAMIGWFANAIMAGYDTACMRSNADVTGLAPRWRDVADELPQEAQEVLFVRGGKTVHGAWIGGIFWHSNQKMAAAYWMPLPLPPNARLSGPQQREEDHE